MRFTLSAILALLFCCFAWHARAEENVIAQPPRLKAMLEQCPGGVVTEATLGIGYEVLHVHCPQAPLEELAAFYKDKLRKAGFSEIQESRYPTGAFNAVGLEAKAGGLVAEIDCREDMLVTEMLSGWDEPLPLSAVPPTIAHYLGRECPLADLTAATHGVNDSAETADGFTAYTEIVSYTTTQDAIEAILDHYKNTFAKRGFGEIDADCDPDSAILFAELGPIHANMSISPQDGAFEVLILFGYTTKDPSGPGAGESSPPGGEGCSVFLAGWADDVRGMHGYRELDRGIERLLGREPTIAVQCVYRTPQGITASIQFQEKHEYLDMAWLLESYLSDFMKEGYEVRNIIPDADSDQNTLSVVKDGVLLDLDFFPLSMPETFWARIGCANQDCFGPFGLEEAAARGVPADHILRAVPQRPGDTLMYHGACPGTLEAGFETRDKVQPVLDYYQKELESDGWTLENKTATTDGGLWMIYENGANLTLGFGAPESDGALPYRITIAY